MKLAFIALATFPALLCSCAIFRSSNGSGLQQSPKLQAMTVPQTPQTEATTVPQAPKTETTVAPQAPKTPPTVVQQTPKAQAAEPRVQPLVVSSESARKTLLGLDLAFSRACEEKGAAEAFYEFMAADGICLLTGEPPIEGRDAIKVRFAAFPGDSISWKPRDSEISSSLDMGYTWGTYQLQTSTADKQSSTGGKYVIVWKKHADGSWKATMFITSAGPTMQRNEE